MSLLSMPFLIINYGCEMIYILEQRLHSQQIKAEKAQKVLHDLTRALFNEAFINELFRPQVIYSSDQTRDVCDKLAQSSIMKLSTDSMDKLFDLVVMGVKYQLLAASHPCQLVDITLNHIDYLVKLGKQSGTTLEAVDKGRSAFVSFAQNLRAEEFALIRQSLLDFSVRKRVKVSLFLQEKMQHNDGRFVLPVGGPLPDEDIVKAPGSIKYSNGTDERFQYPLESSLQPRLGGDPYDSEKRTCTLGSNFYTVDRKKPSRPAQNEAPKPKRHGTTSSGVASAKSGYSSVAAELNSLGALLGVSATSKPSSQFFKMSLFGEAPQAGHEPSSQATTEVIDIPRLQREDLEKHNPELARVMALMDFENSAEAGKTADLADLMDIATQ